MIRVLPMLLLVGCEAFAPTLDPLTTEPMVVAAEETWSLTVDARMPTDLLATRQGWTVLDGYQHRLLHYGPDGVLQATVPLVDLPHRASRLAASREGDGVWLTSPVHPTAVRIDGAGAVAAQVTVQLDGEPVVGLAGLVDRGADLVVAVAEGALLRVDRSTGQVLARQQTDVDGVALEAPVHLAADGEDLLLTDAFGGQVHRFDADLEPVGRAGRHGLWVGTLAKPKAAVPGPLGTVIVADSEQGAVQVFDRDGRALGALAVDGMPLRWSHPLALARSDDPDGGAVIAVLDTVDGAVRALSVTDASIMQARAEVQRWRHLRTDLITVPHEERLADGSLCRSCHDGTLLDDREGWDADLHHHPVDVQPPRPVPGFFPLDGDRRVRCTTCHSPHGTVGVAEVEGGEGRESLVRHAPAPGDQFTRLSRQDSELCVACHTDAAHEQVLDRTVEAGSAHLAGQALKDALARRGGAAVAGLPGDVGSTCLTCHGVHGMPRDGLLRETSSAELCAACHLPQARPGRSHPVGKGGCQSCHTLMGGTQKALLKPAAGGALCTSCHAPLKGAHGRVRGADGASCLGCHDVHDARGKPLVGLRTAAADPSGCQSCHAPGKAGAARSHAGALGHPVEAASLTCATCHTAHRPNQTPACGTCHEPAASAAARGGHGTAVCADCHPVHRGAPSSPARAGLNPRAATCLSCHGPGTGGTKKVAAWDHPTPVFTPDGRRWTPLSGLRLFDAKGEVVPSGSSGALTCSTCHTTHGPPSRGGELLRPGVVEACAACHGEDATRLHRSFHTLTARRR